MLARHPRASLAVLAFGALALIPFIGAEPAAEVSPTAGRPVAPAPFRVLFSNDTTNMMSCPGPGFTDRREGFTDRRIAASVDEAVQADAHLLQPGTGWVPLWKSKIYPADEHYRWFRDSTGLPIDAIGEYMLHGGDVVKPFVDECRKRGVAPFISLRLNDYHGSEADDFLRALIQGKGRGRPYPMFNRTLTGFQSRFFIEHPEYRLRPDPADYTQLSDEERLAYIGQMRRRINLRTARVWNWAIPEVPAYKLAFIREICENYDLSGLELDYMRWSSFFRLNETTSAQRVGIMVDFIRKVRFILDSTAAPGTKRWLCVRVPLRLSGHDPLGVDLPQWVAAGVDLVNLSCHYTSEQQTDLPQICRSIPRTPVYLELTFTSARFPKPGADGKVALSENIDVYRKMTDQQFYTAAHLVYSRGGSGISLFNFPYYRSLTDKKTEPPFYVLSRLKDPAWVARQPQDYFLSSASNPPSAPSQFTRNQVIRSDRPGTYLLDLAPPTGGWTTDGRLRLQSSSSFEGKELQVTCNGQVLRPTADITEPYPSPYVDGLGTAQTLRAWTVPRASLRDGPNTIEAEMTKGSTAEILYLDLAVR